MREKPLFTVIMVSTALYTASNAQNTSVKSFRTSASESSTDVCSKHHLMQPEIEQAFIVIVGCWYNNTVTVVIILLLSHLVFNDLEFCSKQTVASKRCQML